MLNPYYHVPHASIIHQNYYFVLVAINVYVLSSSSYVVCLFNLYLTAHFLLYGHISYFHIHPLVTILHTYPHVLGCYIT